MLIPLNFKQFKIICDLNLSFFSKFYSYFQLVSLLCLASIATGLPQYISPTLGYGVAHAPLGYASSGAIALGGPALSPITGIPTYGSIGGYGISSLAVPKIVAQAPIIQKTIISPPIIKHISPIDPNPQYSYNYGVNDPHTGDNKQAEETLVNGVVHGSYSLTEPDGTIRKVSVIYLFVR